MIKTLVITLSLLTFSFLHIGVLGDSTLTNSILTITPQPCVTVTSTNGGDCPIPTPCTMEYCLLLSTVTQYCGCPSIYTATVCESTCALTCGTTYATLRLPCATSFSPPPTTSTSSNISSSPTSKSSSSSQTITSTSCSSSSLTITSPTSESHSRSYTKAHTGSFATHHHEGNKTITVTEYGTGWENVTTVVITSTSILTLTSCPAEVTCYGQTSTWTGSEGPYTCSAKPACTCVLPGGGGVTTTGSSVRTTTSGGVGAGEVTSSTGTTVNTIKGSATLVLANEGAGRGAGIEGLLFGFAGMILGVM